MTEKSAKPIVFSGIQPTGTLTLGNYIGAVRNWANMQDDYDCIYCVVDMHAITVRHAPDQLRAKSQEALALLIACGLDTKKNVLFIQSQVAAHAQLTWVLNCYSYVGELGRMTQFKDKSAKHQDNINMGLMDYPVLMAADILLYQSNLVPVGADQRQHIELCRDVAERFNVVYGDVFQIPDAFIPQVGAKVMSLQDPTRKMSKSDPEPCYVGMLDAPDVIRKKFRRAVTDTQSVICAAEDKPGITNLMSILSVLSGKSMKQIELDFEGKGYGTFKDAVADIVIASLEPIQKEYNRLLADRSALDAIALEGAQRAALRAQPTLDLVHEKVGLFASGHWS